MLPFSLETPAIDEVVALSFAVSTEVVEATIPSMFAHTFEIVVRARLAGGGAPRGLMKGLVASVPPIAR